MCGRFVSSSSPADLAAWFGAQIGQVGEEAHLPRYNVAPTDDVLVVRAASEQRRVEALHWGLVPGWAEDPKVASRMINARAETVATKGAFKHAFARRRCLVPADGFYEWDRRAGRPSKQAYFVHGADGGPFAFAGLWEVWRRRRSDSVDGLRSTAIVTTDANAVMARIHERMPVILPASAWEEWLDPDHDDTDVLQRLLVPAPPELTVLRPVGPAVGNVRNQGPQLIETVDLGEAEATRSKAGPADRGAALASAPGRTTPHLPGLGP